MVKRISAVAGSTPPNNAFDGSAGGLFLNLID
jgi:hypothetical protein